MERITKVFFDPLATTRAKIQNILKELPVGSAHPFSPDGVLLCRTATGIEEIDISAYPEEFFFNAVDLGELGETLQRRMSGFQSHIALFNEYTVQQAPAATFKVPIVPDKIGLLAVSERTPTYFDFCMADAECHTCCWTARTTFPGIKHSGDILNHNDLLDYIYISEDMSTDKDIAIVISGYQYTKLTRFQGSNPVVMVANHTEKLLYIVPVPLDAATIGEATLCTPLVIRRDGSYLICSILPTPTTDVEKMISSAALPSPSFAEAIRRADFTESIASQIKPISEGNPGTESLPSPTQGNVSKISAKPNAVLATGSVSLPSIINQDSAQIIRFGTGIEFMGRREQNNESDPSTVVLPCIFGSRLEGPILLATGVVPSKIPFSDEYALRAYYEQLSSVVVVVDDRMTDNARNLASPYRINTLFIVEASNLESELKNGEDMSRVLNSLNINAVTALAGPQSLVLVHISSRYYFYRGIANRKFLNTSNLAFGSEVTRIIDSINVETILDPRAKRMINLAEANTVLLPTLRQEVQPQNLKQFFEELSVDQINDLGSDITAVVPQLQVLMSQHELVELSQALISTLSTKVNDETGPMRKAYKEFITNEFKMGDPLLMKKRSDMLGQLRRHTSGLQKDLEAAISALANMMSSQTTSRRTHDLNRLMRQAAIKGNLAAAKQMTFDTLAGLLETHAGDMGVMLLNIETYPYQKLLGNLKDKAINASECCNLDSRVLHLEGFDAGIIIEQSQSGHNGPLRSELGPAHPILALPYLSQSRGDGSMLAWVCWDEFVNLENPYSVRWTDKCNESHIASCRIIMRSTLSKSVASREFNMDPASPETGQLMGALLMAAMSKLATMRTSKPAVTAKAEDTVTKLMRGLFGNLLTLAGSGVRPLSLCWQLFAPQSLLDVPLTVAEWSWYENVVALYPYSGWPLQNFHGNLERLLSKVLIRIVTKNERNDEMKQIRAAQLAEFCRLRNIQLEHSRTIITIFMKMLTQEDIDYQVVADRLLDRLPHKLERQSKSYPKMIGYLNHLAHGGQRRQDNDLVTAGVYTKRSAAFGELKNKIAKACEKNDTEQIKDLCQEMINKHAETAGIWNLQPKLLKLQNLKVYKGLFEANFGDDIDEDTKAHNKSLIAQAIGDAERNRLPWQLGSENKLGETIEPLDEEFVHEILTGEKLAITATGPKQVTATVKTVVKTDTEGLAQFASMLRPQFIAIIEKPLTPTEACRMMGIPDTTMRVFVNALNPNFLWDDLGDNFKKVIVTLVKERSDREGSQPIKQMLDLRTQNLVILGAAN